MSCDLADRNRDRGLHLFTRTYDGQDWRYFGGLGQTPRITSSDLLHMLEILITAPPATYVVEGPDGLLRYDSRPLSDGHYVVLSSDVLLISTEPVLTRATSVTAGPRFRFFDEAVRHRDTHCTITRAPVSNLRGRRGRNPEDYVAVHIFPHAYERLWYQDNYDGCIRLRNMPLPPQGGSINSVENGLLMSAKLHPAFDQYQIAINPDRRCAVVVFNKAYAYLAGKRAPYSVRSHRDKPSYHLLKWHYRQAVLANMRGLGQPVFQHNFPRLLNSKTEFILNPLRAIERGPMPKERFEFEIANRLGAYVDISERDVDGDAEADRPSQPQ